MFEFVIYECIANSDILIANKCRKYKFPLVRITTNVVSSNPAHGEVYSVLDTKLCDKKSLKIPKG